MQAIQPTVTPLRTVKNSPRVTPSPSRPPSRPPSSSPSSPPSRRSSSQHSHHGHPHQNIAMEAGVKLAVNIVLSVCATSALVQLLPHYRAVQEKLQEIQAEVNLTEKRVNQSRSDFNRYFDPSLAKTVMQEQSNRVDPQQRPVILQESDPPETD